MAYVRKAINGGELVTLQGIVSRIHRNIPRSGNPERFHIEKSEIANDLNRVIKALRIGHNIPNLEQDQR